jgi:LacI family transcriptional regulator
MKMDTVSSSTLSDDSFDKEVLNMEMRLCGFIMSPIERNQFKGDFHHISEVIDQGMPVMFDRELMKSCATK